MALLHFFHSPCDEADHPGTEQNHRAGFRNGIVSSYGLEAGLHIIFPVKDQLAGIGKNKRLNPPLNQVDRTGYWPDGSQHVPTTKCRGFAHL